MCILLMPVLAIVLIFMFLVNKFGKYEVSPFKKVRNVQIDTGIWLVYDSIPPEV